MIRLMIISIKQTAPTIFTALSLLGKFSSVNQQIGQLPDNTNRQMTLNSARKFFQQSMAFLDHAIKRIFPLNEPAGILRDFPQFVTL